MTIQVVAGMYRCCCCIDLRIGCIVIAILQIVGSLGISGIPIFHSPPYVTCFIIDCLAGVTAGICLLIGVIKFEASAILVYLILAVINFIIRFVIFGFTVFILLGLNLLWCLYAALPPKNWNAPPLESHKRCQIIEGHVLEISIIGIPITVMALSIYFWVCVYRFYKLTKYGKKTSDFIQSKNK